MSKSRGIAYCHERQVSTIRLKLTLSCEISEYEVDSMQDSFIIRNHEDYLRAHITVLRRSPQKLELVVVSEKQSGTKGDRSQQRPQVNGRGKPAKHRFFSTE
jgi:hypothetical protein